jgi:hypothetical protein
VGVFKIGSLWFGKSYNPEVRRLKLTEFLPLSSNLYFYISTSGKGRICLRRYSNIKRSACMTETSRSESFVKQNWKSKHKFFFHPSDMFEIGKR